MTERKAYLVMASQRHNTQVRNYKLRLFFENGSGHVTHSQAMASEFEKEGLERTLDQTQISAANYLESNAREMGKAFAHNDLRHLGDISYVFTQISSPEYKVVKGLGENTFDSLSKGNKSGILSRRYLSIVQPVDGNVLSAFVMSYMKHLPLQRAKTEIKNYDSTAADFKPIVT